MKPTYALVAIGPSLATAHYVFPSIANTQAWQYVRETANHYSTAPVSSVLSPNMTCFQLAPGSEGAATYNISAGGTLTLTSEPTVYHPGPMMAYLGKVPAGETAATWDGSGANWFKIFEDHPLTSSTYEMMWPNMNLASFSFTIPTCLSGQYLFRIEHIGLHVAMTVNGSQPFLSCTQIDITSSSGTNQPPAAGSKYLVSFPGAYSPTDPGLLIDIYNNIAAQVANYTTPGPPVWTCGATG